MRAYRPGRTGGRETERVNLETGAKPLFRSLRPFASPHEPVAFAARPSETMTFVSEDRPAKIGRRGAANADGSRVLLASHDVGFLDHALAKLRGTSIRAGVATNVDGILKEILRLRPHVAIVSDTLLEADPDLGRTLSARYPNLPVLVVGSEGRAHGKEDWRIVSWGGIGLVPEVELLRGQVLPMVIHELARLRSGGGPSVP